MNLGPSSRKDKFARMSQYAEDRKKKKKRLVTRGDVLDEREVDDEEQVTHKEEEANEQLQFEDPFEDEFEEEEVEPVEEKKEEEEDWEDEVEVANKPVKIRALTKDELTKLKGNRMNEEEKTSSRAIPKPDVFLGSSKTIGREEVLDFDNRSYDMLHRVQTEWPCLSCDFVVPDQDPSNPGRLEPVQMKKYPYTVYLVAGTQASSATKNEIYVMKFAELHKTKYDDDSMDGDSEDEDNDEDPKLQIRSVAHRQPINRVRSMNSSPIVAVWDEAGVVSIIDLTKHVRHLAQTPNDAFKREKPKEASVLGSFQQSAEGFALAWNQVQTGVLAAGARDSVVRLYEPRESQSAWAAGPVITAHSDSVEDLGFSPSEAHVLASCSVDRSVRIYDLRERASLKRGSIIIEEAHASDVNVISWEDKLSRLLASGGDDGNFRIWDVRHPNRPISDITWHTEAITSIQFQPGEDAVVAVASADNRLSIWDFATEPDHGDAQNDMEIPDQLLFLHQGQDDVKELRWHPVYTEMIISTAANGFHAFKPNLEDDEMREFDDERDDEIQIQLD
eukprot:TRINITY_DN8696_c0_g1_i1.p1 TRINITY_DN8696_c0_g1~~TRINITY_DN8696_c0_g1_i1.p1  ORF type:complete len:560 (+),score=176.48 TRINITY_DN8696_c0_g1_i1:124-1803(+)